MRGFCRDLCCRNGYAVVDGNDGHGGSESDASRNDHDKGGDVNSKDPGHDDACQGDGSTRGRSNRKKQYV